MPVRIITPPFRASYANIVKPRRTPSGDMKYQISMIFPKGTDLTAMKTAAKEAAQEKWGPDASKWPKNLRLPFRDGAERQEEAYKNAIFVGASADRKPGIVDQNKQEIIDEDEIYSGMWARASVTAFAYDNSGNKGISFGLNNVQKLKDGERLDGRRSAEDDFKDVPVDPGFVSKDPGSSTSLFD